MRAPPQLADTSVIFQQVLAYSPVGGQNFAHHFIWQAMSRSTIFKTHCMESFVRWARCRAFRNTLLFELHFLHGRQPGYLNRLKRSASIYKPAASLSSVSLVIDARRWHFTSMVIHVRQNLLNSGTRTALRNHVLDNRNRVCERYLLAWQLFLVRG